MFTYPLTDRKIITTEHYFPQNPVGADLAPTGFLFHPSQQPSKRIHMFIFFPLHFAETMDVENAYLV